MPLLSRRCDGSGQRYPYHFRCGGFVAGGHGFGGMMGGLRWG